MGKIKSRIDLARSRARQRRATARRRWHNMSLRTAFICYVLIAAALSTAACMAMIKLLDEPRIALYQKYNEMAEEVKIPQGGSYRNYVTVDGAEAYIIFDSSGREVDRGEVPYGEGHIELGLGSDMRFALFIQPRVLPARPVLDPLPGGPAGGLAAHLLPGRAHTLRRGLLALAAARPHRGPGAGQRAHNGQRPGLQPPRRALR